MKGIQSFYYKYLRFDTFVAKKGMKKQRDPEKYEYAYMLYMKKVPQKEISERVGISAQTITKWVREMGWEEKRAARVISMDELIAKALRKINEILDDTEFNADSFAKAVKQLKELKSGTYVNDDINVFTLFGDWLIEQMATDKEIDSAFLKKVTAYQDKYIQCRIRSPR
jgi:hypothetical protein